MYSFPRNPVVVPNGTSNIEFFVQSTDDQEVRYHVDLSAFENNGRCDCEDFRMRCAPTLSTAEHTHFVFCKHIIAARNALLEKLIEEVKSVEEGGTRNEQGHRKQP